MSEIDRKWTEGGRAPLAHAAPLSGITTAGQTTPSFPGYGTSADSSGSRGVIGTIWPYVQIARADHWFKNAFMLLGVILAFFYEPELFRLGSIPALATAVLATCLVASSNYVLNEWLDGPRDRVHPQKRRRPVPSGKIKGPLAYTEWLLLGIIGVGIAATVNLPFALSALALWVLGVTYNVPPIRTKEVPYIDVLSESANNAVRLLLGWFPLIADRVPPVSLVLSYWMVGAFFMATKRFAEYRHIGDPAVAAEYRRSFRYYNEQRLLVSIMFYATTCALFAGVFIVRYHLELILFVPLAAGVFAYYLHIGMVPDSPAQSPEKLYTQKGFFAYLCVCVAVFVALMFTSVPALYDVFNVDPTRTAALWTVGDPR